MVEGLALRHVEHDGFARLRIAVPVRDLEIIIAPLEAGTVVHTWPGRLADAVHALEPPALQVIGVVHLNLADRCLLRDGRQRLIKAVAKVKATADGCVRQRLFIGRRVSGHLAPGKPCDLRIAEHGIEDTQLADIAAAGEVVVAGHVPAADDVLVRAELIQRDGILRRAVFLRRLLAVDVQLQAPIFIPADAEMIPGLGIEFFGLHLISHAGAGQVDVRDQRFDAVASPVNAAPDLIPGGAVRHRDAEQGEFRRPHRISGAPEVAEGAAVGIDIARRPPSQLLGAVAMDRAAVLAFREVDLTAEGGRCAAIGILCRVRRAGEIEQQSFHMLHHGCPPS